ncbi:MAG TPA: hypothetical protein VNC50_19915, partial [Planctomycetia bacterium]|nr:hypothetical protein [Planctomycetia bacterium]
MLASLLLILAPCGEPLGVAPRVALLDADSYGMQLLATAGAETEPQLDVTADVKWSVSPGDLASVDETGWLTPRRAGEGKVVVERDGERRETALKIGPARNTPPSFRLDAMSALSKGGCNQGACHGALSGRGGFRLSLRGDLPDPDWFSITRKQTGRRIDAGSPANSLLLAKPLGEIAHEGGKRFARGSAPHRRLLSWLSAGALDDRSEAPRVAKLEITPRQRVIRSSGRKQQLAVVATLSTGETRDVTREACYEWNDPARASV